MLQPVAASHRIASHRIAIAHSLTLVQNTPVQRRIDRSQLDATGERSSVCMRAAERENALVQNAPVQCSVASQH